MEDIESSDKIGTLWESYPIPLTNSKKLSVRRVYYKNMDFLDIRLWIRFRGEETFFPTRRGIFIEAKVVKEELLPLLQKLVEVKG